MTTKLEQIGRIALRVEGDKWAAYYALNETMKGAIFLGSIRMGAVRGNPVRREQFMLMMRSIVEDIIEKETGERPSFDQVNKAPEHERAGRS